MASNRFFTCMTLLIASVCGIFLALLGGQLILADTDSRMLQSYNQQLLEHGEKVARESRLTLLAVADSPEESCSEADLQQLRLLLFNSHYLSDIGRLRDDRLICSAITGRQSPARPLPPAQNTTANGTRLWAGERNVLSHGITADMAALGPAIVFTSPHAFDRFNRPADGIASLLQNHAGTHVFQTFGDVQALRSALEEKLPRRLFSQSRLQQQCSGQRDICAISYYAHSSILRQPPTVVLGLLLLGGLAGLSLGLLIRHKHREYFSLKQQLARALELRLFSMVYQPLVRLGDQQVIGVEALVRWRDEDGQEVAPDIFVSLAEETGQINKLSRLVVRKTLEELQQLLTADDDFCVCINLDASDILCPRFQDFLISEVQRHGIAPERIVLEITERSTADYQVLGQAVANLRQLGLRCSLDDFGTGYSNLAYLSQLPVDILKLDKLFTQTMGTHSIGATLAMQICQLAGNLGLTLVIEGIETQEQAERIAQEYPQAIGQGWYFGHPRAAADL